MKVFFERIFVFLKIIKEEIKPLWHATEKGYSVVLIATGYLTEKEQALAKNRVLKAASIKKTKKLKQDSL